MSPAISRAAKSMSLVALLALVSACGGRTYLDGFPVGERMCSDVQAVDWLCEGLTAFGVSALDEAEPGHAPVASVELYRPDYRTSDGGKILHTRGTAGGEAIVALRLADDTVRAFYVGCIAGPWGQAPSPPPDGVHCNLMSPMPGES